MIISNANVKRAGPKPMIQCVLNAEQHVGFQVTGVLTTGGSRAGKPHTQIHSVMMLICHSPLCQIVEMLPQGQDVVAFATRARVDAPSLHATTEAAD